MVRNSLALLCAVLAISGAAHAQTAANFPSKSIRFVLPYPPGGGSDTIGGHLRIA